MLYRFRLFFALLLLYGGALLVSGCAAPSPATPTEGAPPPATASNAAGGMGDAKEAFARRHLVRGLTRARLGDAAGAVRHYEQALDAAPEAPAILSALAEAQAAQGALSEALYHARQARRLGVEEPHYHRRLARLHQRAAQPAQALDAYRALIERFPGDDAARLSYARLLADQGRTRAALATYEALTEAGHAPSALLDEMLTLYRAAGDADGTERTLRALVRQRPQAGTPRRALARFYHDEGQPQAALPLLEQALERTPGDAETVALLAGAYRAAGRAQDADALERRSSGEATATGEANASIEQLVARARALSERPGDEEAARTAENTAERLLERALGVDPAHPGALALLGDLRFEAGAFAKAADLLLRALAVDPRAPERWARAAEAFLEADRPERAAAAADEGLLFFPGQVPLLGAHARALVQLGRDTDAARRFEEALRVMRADGLLDASARTPAHAALAARFHDALAHLYRRQEQPDRAARHRERARALRAATSTASN